MELKTLRNQTIALAGVAQSTVLVQQFATTGTADNTAFTASIGSVLKIDSANVLDVYGGELKYLQLGLHHLAEQLEKNNNHDTGRYAASLIFLENQLAKQTKMLNTIQIGITKAQAQTEYFGLLHENVLANLADVYSSTISQLQPRIMVNGDSAYLSRPEIANKIRACLLAGIRSALLWRQCGGTRWKFLFYRKKMLAELNQLITQVTHDLK